MLPFSLSGPQFLTFYFLFALLLLALYWLLYGVAPAAGRPGMKLDALTADPYRIACLRGGPDEAVRLAVVNLVDRGLLAGAENGSLRVTPQAHPDIQRRSLDRVILRRCAAAAMRPDAIVADREVRTAAAELESELQQQGLLRSADDRAARDRARRLAVLVLAFVALVRIVQALLAGRSNIEGLIVLALVACGLVWMLPRRQLTREGQRALESLQALLARLQQRANRLLPGGATNEAVLFASVFGIYALPAAAFPFVEQTYPKPKPASDSGGSGSDSGGSSCGGGGGCGGCGGGGD